jgi:hypothetical protein
VPQVITTQPPATTTPAPTTTTVACLPNGPLDSGPACTASSQCCEGCCIDADLTFQTLPAICEAAFPPPGFSVQRAECEQLIAEMNIFDVCASNQIVTHPGLFPTRVSILPCLL